MDEIFLLITLAFYLITVVGLVRYVWKDFASKSPASTVNPNAFLMVSIACLVVTGAFTAVFGFARAPFAAVFSVGIVLSVLHPGAALCFLLANSIMRPWEINEVEEVMAFIPKSMGLLSLASWAFHGIMRKNLSFVWNRPTWLFLSLALWVLIAAATSGDFDGGIQQYMGTFFVAAVLFTLVSNVITQPADFEALRKTLVCSIACVIAVATYRTVALWGWSLGAHRLDGLGLVGNANDLAALIVLAIPLTLYKRQAMSWFYLSIFVLGLVLAQSRGSFLALGMSLVAYLLVRMKDVKKAVLIGSVLMPLLFGGISIINSMRASDDISGSNQSRFTFFLAGLNMAIRNPIIGVGFNNYPKNFEQYAPSIEGEWGERTAHSSWVLVLAETGFPGFLFFASLYFSILLRSWKLKETMPALFVSIIGYGVAMSFLSHTYMFFPYVLFAMVLAIGKIKKQLLPAQAMSKELVPASVGRGVGIATLIAAYFLATPVIAHADAALEVVSSGLKPVGSRAPKTSARLDLKGSRGEILNFQMKAKLKGCHVWSWSELKSETKGKKSASRPEVDFFEMPTIDITQKSFPKAELGKHFDPLIPVASGKLCPPPAEQGVWYWGELEIPKEMEPGSYQGKLELRPIESSGKSVQLPVSLKVWKMKIPEQPSLPAYAEMSPWSATLGHHGKWHEGEEKLAALYFKEMERHRIIPIKSFIATPEIVRNGEKLSLEIDKKPVPAQSFSAINLKLRPKWAYFDFPPPAMDQVDSPKTIEYFKAIEGTLDRIKRPGKALVYLWDEPQPEAFPSLLRLSKIAKQNAPSLKLLVTTPYRKELEETVDIFAPVMDQFDVRDYPPPAEYRKLQSKGKEVWLYVSCMSHGCDALSDSGTPDLIVERPASYVRSIAWIASKYQVNGFLYYMVNYAYKDYPKRDPWKSIWDFSGNGDGTLFYPGRPGENGQTQHGPIPSIRLKLWRESSYDADYIAWMEKSKNPPSWWKKQFNELVKNTKDWQRDYLAYQELREKIGEHLSQQKGKLD